ncbi:MAG: DUF1080 domain-containing protein [Pirellula sp.]|jgi:hypothetical protein|nr:DUF1080 domain-containing protein [Pirellula sp.]
MPVRYIVWAAWLVCAAACPWSPCPWSRGQEVQELNQEETEFRSIFDGKSLDGWDGDPRLWSVRDGIIRGETTPDKAAQGNTFLIWKGGEVKDFELRLSFRCNATNNSGIQYRSQHVVGPSARNAWIVRGYQHELRNELAFPNVSGFIYDEGGSRKRLCLVGERAEWRQGGKQVVEQFLDETEFRQIFRLNDWNDVVILAVGNRIRHFMNGHLILDFTDNDEALAKSEGVLALQLHAGNPMWVEFRNIRLRDLPSSDPASGRSR